MSLRVEWRSWSHMNKRYDGIEVIWTIRLTALKWLERAEWRRWSCLNTQKYGWTPYRPGKTIQVGIRNCVYNICYFLWNGRNQLFLRDFYPCHIIWLATPNFGPWKHSVAADIAYYKWRIFPTVDIAIMISHY